MSSSLEEAALISNASLVDALRDYLCGVPSRSALGAKEQLGLFPYSHVNEAKVFLMDARGLFSGYTQLLRDLPSRDPAAISTMLGSPHRIVRMLPVMVIGWHEAAVSGKTAVCAVEHGLDLARAVIAKAGGTSDAVAAAEGECSPALVARLAGALYEYADLINLGERVLSVHFEVHPGPSSGSTTIIRQYQNLGDLGAPSVRIIQSISGKPPTVDIFRGKLSRAISLDEVESAQVIVEDQTVDDDRALQDLIEMTVSEIFDTSARYDQLSREELEIRRAEAFAYGLTVERGGEWGNVEVAGRQEAPEPWVQRYLDALLASSIALGEVLRD